MRRYPGLSPFTKEQKDVFFGRKNDIRQLSKLIFVEGKVLLYSKSGYGKTSLLNAGVIPELSKNEDFEFIHIRFRAYTKDGNTPDDTFLQTVKLHPDFKTTKNDTLIDLYAQDFADEYWSVFKKNQLAGNHNKTYLLVFDQFEELFTYPDEQISRFKNKLADLLAGKMPEFIRNFERTLFKNKKAIGKADFEQFYNALNIKAVFSMRSDRLSELNALADKITDIQKVFYELQPLNEEQAKQAIINPGKEKADKYDSPRIIFEDEAIKKILNSLIGKDRQNFETTQLQIVCQRIEEDTIVDILRNYSSSVKIKNLTITINENSLPDFKHIFLNFYNSSIEKVKTDYENDVRKFIEDQLIIEDRRVSLDANVCKMYVNDETLKTLVESRLLRVERNNVDSFSYELSHDTLVPPIKEIADKRRDVEEKERLRAKQRQQIRIIVLAVLISIISIGAAIFGIVMWQKAEKQTEIAEKNEEEAKQNLARAEEMQRKVETAMFDKAVKEHFDQWKGYANMTYNGNLKDEGKEILNQIDSLDLSNNALLRVPQEIAECPNLKHINLLGNKDMDWTDCFIKVKATGINSVYVSVNDLSDINSTYWHLITGIELLEYYNKNEIPQNILQQKQLTWLRINCGYIEENQFKTLPYELFEMTGLQHLELQHAGIDSLPPEIGKLNNLTYLNLGRNQLSSLPSEIGKLNNLSELDLSSNFRLSSLPPEIGKLSNLTQLDLSFNQLSSLPPEIGKLNNLTYLNLEENNLGSLPPEIGKLNNLTELDLSVNGLISLPPEIGKLDKLTTLHLGGSLNVGGNQLSSLPPEIGKLNNLTKLDLSWNKLSSLPPEIGKLNNLTKLDLSWNKLSSLPPEIGKLNNLTKLDLSWNKLSSLPPEIRKLDNLTELNLNGNESLDIATVFSAFSQFDKNIEITTYEFARNDDKSKLLIILPKIDKLPSEIGTFTKLTRLDFSSSIYDLNRNQLSRLPPEIGKLNNLTTLNLRYNDLSSLPSEIGKLNNLTTLDLGGNELHRLPPEVRKLNNLTELNLGGNELSSLPPEIGNLTKLKWLSLRDNNFSAAEKQKIESWFEGTGCEIKW